MNAAVKGDSTLVERFGLFRCDLMGKICILGRVTTVFGWLLIIWKKIIILFSADSSSVSQPQGDRLKLATEHCLRPVFSTVE